MKYDWRMYLFYPQSIYSRLFDSTGKQFFVFTEQNNKMMIKHTFKKKKKKTTENSTRKKHYSTSSILAGLASLAATMDGGERRANTIFISLYRLGTVVHRRFLLRS